MLKILFKPIKWILGIILGLVILIAIPIALLYKSVTPPTLSDETIDFEEYIIEEVDHLIDPVNDDKSLDLAIDENMVNSMIHAELIKQFEETDDSNYLYKDENIMFQGAWVEFTDDTVNIIVGAHANARIFTFKTRVLISFKILENEDNPAELTLKLDKLKIGNLSLRWVLRFAPKIAERFLGQDIDSFIEDSIGNFGTYDSDKMELKIDLYQLTEELGDNKDIADLLLDVIYGNDLLELGVIESDEEFKFGIKLNLNKIEDSSPTYNLPEAERIETEQEFNEFLYNKALTGIISSNNAIRFNTLEINKVIDYIFHQSSETTAEYLMKTELYKDYEVIVGNPYLEIDNNLVVSIPVKIGKDSNYFETKFKLQVDLHVLGDDLEILFKTVDIGEIVIDEENISAILDVAGQDNIVDSKMIIKDFFLSFKEANITINDITVVNDTILFHYEGFDVDEILDDIQNIINNPILNDKVEELINKFDNEEEITEEDVEDLMEIFEGLTEDELNEIQDIINGYLNQ